MKRNIICFLLATICVLTMGLATPMSLAHAATSESNVGETPSGIPLNKLEDTVDEYVSQYIGKTTPGAAIAVVKDGQILLLKGYGYSDLENETPVDPKSTVFEWASTSKLYTWTSAMQLVEQGKLDLDADISTYLPSGFVNKLNLNQAITMRDIMNHSAGFGDYAFNTIVFSPDELVSLEEAILRDQPEQYYEVGTASAYSNYATSLAGYMVQTISNQSYADYEQEHIFNALSMNQTSPSSSLSNEMATVKAKGYIPNPKGGFVQGNWSYISHAPAGALNGTVEDFAKFAMALTPNQGEKSPLFNEAHTLTTMLSPSYDINGDSVGTAHGFFEYVGEYPTYGHGGNTAAFSSQFAIVPEERFGIVVLTNAYLEMDILFGLQDLLLGKKDSSIEMPISSLPSSEEVTGNYVPMERQEGNFVDFAKYISLYKVEATGVNEITLSLGAYKGTYVQTKPYYYEIVDDNIPFFRNAYPILRFKMDNGIAKQIVVGHGLDLSALPFGRTTPLLIGSLMTLIISMLYFFITPAILLIIAFKNRKKTLAPINKKLNIYHGSLVLLGTITLTNNLIPSTKIMVNNFRTFAEMKPHILLNYPLLLMTLIITLLSLSTIKKATVSRSYKVFYIINCIMLTLLFTMLIGWNYFAIVG